MPRAIKKLSISFGMVTVPVAVYTATEDKDIHFHTLHDTCRSRLRQKRWCPVDDREVLPDEVVRGYEWAKDHFVVVPEEAFDDLPVPSKLTIEVTGFVRLAEVDPAYFQKSYWLEPEQVGLKAYALLTEAMREKDVAALGKVTLRSKEQICLLRVTDQALVMETLYWPDEVRLTSVESPPQVLVAEREREVAAMLVEAMTGPFQPELFQDSYRAAVLDLIERLKEGLPPEEAPKPAPPPPSDLMAALRASLDALKARGQEAQEASDAPPPPPEKTPRRKKGAA